MSIMEFNFEKLKLKLDQEFEVDSYNQELADLEARYNIKEYESKLEVLRWVKSQVNGGDSSESPKTVSSQNSNQRKPPSSLRNMILEVSADLTDGFNSNDILKKIEETFDIDLDSIKKSSMRTSLWQLRKDGLLENITVGGGNRQSTYKFVKS